MLKRILIAFSAALILLLSSCTVADITGGGDEFKLTFVYGDGRENREETYSVGDTVVVEIPERDGYSFVGWCTDEKLNNFHDFSKYPDADTTLYAKWDIDYQYWLSRVASEGSPSCLTVVTPPSGSIFSTAKQGSGVIFKNEGSTWYALTNNHVVTRDSGTIASVTYAHDVYGNEYRAEILKADAAYDLAVIKFTAPSTVSLATSKIISRLPLLDEKLVTVSAPNGKPNTVELGELKWYNELDEDSSSLKVSDVNFKVLWISGAADHGSSGGAVYDKDMNLVGIIYAVATDRVSKDNHILAIPAEKILEFINSWEAEQ